MQEHVELTNNEVIEAHQEITKLTEIFEENVFYINPER